MTLPEKRLWAELRKLGAHFRRQAPVGKYVADFASHAAKLVIEVDGYWHGLDERKTSDALRTAWLESQGYRVVRVSNVDVMEDLESVVERVRAALSPPSPTLPPSRGKGEDI